MNRIAIDCACRLTREALRSDADLVILASERDSDTLRRAVGTVLPEGSTNTGAVWTTPEGKMVSVKRYGDARPDYRRRPAVRVCNGGRVLSRQETQHVERWYEGKAIPFVGAPR